MPHIVILYTGDLDELPAADIGGLCRRLADTLLTVRDDADAQVYPTGGMRVLAYPAPHFAVADGSGEHSFVYINLRMGRGRSAELQQRAGAALAAAVHEHLAPLLAVRPVGVTLQIDEGPEVFDAKLGNLHALFAKAG